MSQTNTQLDRDANGRLIRRYKLKGTKKAAGMAFTTSSWWVNLHMNRPRRRLEKRLCKDVLAGVDTDGLVWPLGSHKPHEYYW